MVDDQDHVQQVEKAIAEMGYETNSNMQWLTSMQDQTKFLRSILGAIGVVAFIVAAISIANTMVMSIYERTREIGIMKVLGCKLSDIRGMFLIEAAIIRNNRRSIGSSAELCRVIRRKLACQKRRNVDDGNRRCDVELIHYPAMAGSGGAGSGNDRRCCFGTVSRNKSNQTFRFGSLLRTNNN